MQGIAKQNRFDNGEPDSDHDGHSGQEVSAADTDIDSDAPIADEFPPRIDPGEYDAVCYRTEVAKCFGKEDRIFIRFRLTGGKYDGTSLFMACPFHPKGKLTHNHKFYRQWVLANGALPRRGERLSRKVFLHKMFTILVRDTRRKHSHGKPLDEILQYSVVDSILRRITGLPPQERSG